MNLLSLVPKSMQNPEFSANTNYWLHFTRFPQLLNKHFHFRSLRRTRGRMIRQQRCPGSWPISRPGLSSVSSSLSSSNPPWNWSECVPNLKLGLSNLQAANLRLKCRYIYIYICRYAKEMEAWELARLQKDDRWELSLLLQLELLFLSPQHPIYHTTVCTVYQFGNAQYHPAEFWVQRPPSSDLLKFCTAPIPTKFCTAAIPTRLGMSCPSSCATWRTGETSNHWNYSLKNLLYHLSFLGHGKMLAFTALTLLHQLLNPSASQHGPVSLAIASASLLRAL